MCVFFSTRRRSEIKKSTCSNLLFSLYQKTKPTKEPEISCFPKLNKSNQEHKTPNHYSDTFIGSIEQNNTSYLASNVETTTCNQSPPSPAVNVSDTPEPNKTIKSGYLHKRPQIASNLHVVGMNKNRLWPKRYIVISSSGELLIYRNEKKASEPERFNLLSTTAKIVEGHSNMIDLISPSKTVRFLSKESNENCSNSMASWFGSISETRVKLTDDFLSLNGKVQTQAQMQSESLKQNQEQTKVQEQISPPIKDKEKLKSLKTKILNQNNYCVDCLKPNPDWCSINLGIVMCIDCSGVHRRLGVEISKVRSLKMDKLSEFDLVLLKTVGNDKFNKSFGEKEKGKQIQTNVTKSNFSNMNERNDFITAKYTRAIGDTENYTAQKLSKITATLNVVDFLQFCRNVKPSVQNFDQQISDFTCLLVKSIKSSNDSCLYGCLAVILHFKMIKGTHQNTD